MIIVKGITKDGIEHYYGEFDSKLEAEDFINWLLDPDNGEPESRRPLKMWWKHADPIES